MKIDFNQIKKVKVIECFFCILMILIAFYAMGVKYLSKYFNYIDEIFTIFFISTAIVKTLIAKKINLNKYDKMIAVLLMLLMIIGVIGNCISVYQEDIIQILVDMLSYCKLFGVYLAAKIMFEEKNTERYYIMAEYFVKLILFLMSTVLILNQILNLGFANTFKKYGLPIYSLGGHPSFAAAVAVACISILLLDYKKNIKWIIIGVILVIFTWRVKAFVYVAIMLIYIFINNGKKKKKVKGLIISGIVSLLIAGKKFFQYFLVDGASRGTALKSGLKLAKLFFPLGSGFATFGSVTSINSYSKAYEILNLTEKYGFMKNAGSFVGDGRLGNSDWTVWLNWHNNLFCYFDFNVYKYQQN